jgi:hypothetical protein
MTDWDTVAIYTFQEIFFSIFIFLPWIIFFGIVIGLIIKTFKSLAR